VKTSQEPVCMQLFYIHQQLLPTILLLLNYWRSSCRCMEEADCLYFILFLTFCILLSLLAPKLELFSNPILACHGHYPLLLNTVNL
jgi:hypothetical protein